MNIIKDQKGFTLTEIIIAISIIFILSVVSYPVYSAYAPHYRLKGASKELASALQSAQGEAVSKQYLYIVRFQSSSYQIIKSDMGNEVLEQTVDLPAGISTSDITLEQNQVIFTASGVPQKYGTLKLNNIRGENKTIEITSSGQIKSY